MQRILVIDDDSSIRSLFRRGLGYENFEVKVAESGSQGLALIAVEKPDLVILDVKMPGMTGFDVMQSIRQTGNKVPVIMLTALDSIEIQLECLNSGADDYVAKPVGFDVLLARIRAIQVRNGSIVSPRLRFHDLHMNLETHTVTRGERQIDLTEIEFVVLQAFLEEPERAISSEKLLHLTSNLNADLATLETCLKDLRHKLELGGDGRLIYTLNDGGFILRQT
jgi:DNA-binding response OmpR family regulator